MKLDILPIGLYGENTYILHDQQHVLIVDPGAQAKYIFPFIEPGEVVDGIVLTHGHEDHTLSADDLSEAYHCPVYMDMDDYFLVDPKETRYGYDAPVYAAITPLEETMTIGKFPLQVISTPGHTIGSVCIRYRNLLFTGDTLFAGDIGRTDLMSGDEEQMMKSLQIFKTLPHDLRILPGHGPSSTIKQELLMNPYLR